MVLSTNSEEYIQGGKGHHVNLLFSRLVVAKMARRPPIPTLMMLWEEVAEMRLNLEMSM